jgi:hypothetical protein
MEPEGSLPYSQESATVLYREPDEWCPHPLPISLIPILIVPCHLGPGSPNGLSPSGFPAKVLYSLISHAWYVPCTSYPPWLDRFNYTWRRVQVMKLLILHFSPASYYIILLPSKHSHNLNNCCCENLKTYIKISDYLKTNRLSSIDDSDSLDGHAGILHLPTIFLHEICIFLYRYVTIHNFSITVE